MKKSVLNIFAVLTVLQVSYHFDSHAWASCESSQEETIRESAAYCEISDCPNGGTYGKFSIITSDLGNGRTVPMALCTIYNCISNEPIGGGAFIIGDCGAQLPFATKLIQDFIKPKIACASIIHMESQIVGESIPIVGTDIRLNYFSNWVAGRSADYTLTIPIAGDTPRDAILSFDVELKLGSTIVQTAHYVNDQSNVSYAYTWNGLDSSSNPTLGTQKYNVVVTENYASIHLPISSEVDLGSFKAKLLGLGAWVPDIFSFYDFNAKKLYRGDGSIRHVTAKVLSGGGYWIADEDGQKVSHFDAAGRIASIKNGLIGTTLYTFNYDVGGRLVSIVEPYNRTTSFNRSGGLFVSITAPKGQVSTVSLDSSGYLASLTNPNSETYSMAYWDAGGLLKTFTRPQGQISTFTYDADGALNNETKSSGYFFDLIKNLNTGYIADTSKVTPLGRETRVQADAGAKIVSRKTIFPSSLQESYSYDDSNNGYRIESLSLKGTTTSSSFQNDARFGEMGKFASQNSVTYGGVAYLVLNSQSITLTDPDDPFSISAYSVNSQKGNLNVTTTYNPTTKVFNTSTSLGNTSETAIDTYERVSSQKRGNLYPVEFTYTDENLTKIKQNTRETNLAYNSTTGFLSSITNPLSQTVAFAYDNAGRVVSKILPDLRTIAYSYDANGNISGVTPPGRSIHIFGLNANELPSTYEPPLLSGVTTVQTSYAYNDDKQLTQVTKPNGDSIVYNYGSTTGVLQSIVTPTKTYNITLNYSNEMPYTITPTTGPITYIDTYAGLMPTQITTYDGSYAYISGFTKTLSSNGTVGSDTVATGSYMDQVYYSYDDDEKLIGAGDLSLTYNTPNAQLTGTSLGSSPNIVTDEYTYNSYGEVTGYQAKYGSSVIYDLTLGRDALGRVFSKSQTMNGTTEAFAYSFDAAGRLIETSKNNAVVATYGYDDNSNRNAGTIGSQPTTASYDAQDRMTAYNLFSFTYNANGDLTGKTNTLLSTTISYTYDVFGNLTSVTLPNGDVITYEVDGLNRRIGKSINGVLQKRWVYMDQTRIAAEIDASGTITKRFVYGSKGNIPDYMILADEDYRIVSDHLGSPRLVVKVADGSILARMNHDEFGRVTEDTNPGLLPFGFAGGLYDGDTGLVRFGARDYDPETGRWTSKDPILFDGGDTNLYGYVFQDPVNFIDPSGKLFERIIANYLSANQQAVVGAVLAAAGTYATVSGVSTLNGPLALLGAFATYEGIRNGQLAKDRGLTLPSIPNLNDVSNRAPRSINAASNPFPIPLPRQTSPAQGGDVCK